LWALLGIEAVYVVGEEGITQQIHEKTQIYLGEKSNFKKSIKSMYNFRSKFIHGELEIPSYFRHHHSSNEHEKYDKEITEATQLAVGILTATLQKLIIQDKKTLTFKYIIE
jgi:hypothetical protein